MDKKEIILLFDKLIERKLNQFYEEKIKPDIEEMIKNANKKEDVRGPIIRDNKVETAGSLMSIMEDDDLDDNLKPKKKVAEVRAFPAFKGKKAPEFNTKNEHLNNILTEMASDPSKYRVPKDAEALVMMNGSLGSEAGSQYETLNFNSDMVSPGRNPIKEESGYSLEDVQTAVAYQSGNPDVAAVMIKDYSAVLKKSKELSKRKG